MHLYFLEVDIERYKYMSNVKTLIIDYKENIPATIESLIPAEYKYHFFRAEVDGRLRELAYTVNKPCKIELFPLNGDSEAMLIYRNSLMYLLCKAIHNVHPGLKIKVNHSISRSLYVTPLDPNQAINQNELRQISLELNRIIQADLPIKRHSLTISKAKEYYVKLDMKDKLDILRYRNEEPVHLYECDDYFDYFYSYMVPSSGYIKQFNLIWFTPGFLVQYPRHDFEGQIPPFEPETVYARTLEATKVWARKVNLSTIPQINDYANNYGNVDFVMMCESHISNQLSELGNQIISSQSPIKLICIAGPSSSGKTTFANRLRLELLSKGLNPIRISCDDYYKEKKDMTPLPDGSYDLETIDAIDVKLFNEQMAKLADGQEVTLPKFNFSLGKREEGRKLQLKPGEPLIVEGIHALNEVMTSSINSSNKFKIFIAPQAQINIDNHSPISVTDIRLLRRIVRDSKFRGSSAEDTIKMWPSVRRGEFNWIYSTQEQADYVFNSLLPYELCVMKKYAYPLLAKIEKNSDTYVTCRRLMLFLKYFSDIDESVVPNNSLMREFIGGSCFKDV